jgi:hypothetical protein
MDAMDIMDTMDLMRPMRRMRRCTPIVGCDDRRMMMKPARAAPGPLPKPGQPA